MKAKVEEHLKECPVCRAKLNIISSLFTDVKKKYCSKDEEEVYSTKTHSSGQYQFFKKNLSAYVDNELPQEDNVKMRKYSDSDSRSDYYNSRKYLNRKYSSINYSDNSNDDKYNSDSSYLTNK